MNIVFFLTPKASCAYLCTGDTIRQAMEKMECSGYEALPILNPDGSYNGTLSSGDLLRAIKTVCGLDMEQAEQHGILEIPRRHNYKEVSVTMDMRDLILAATQQNFVPVVDDRKSFIGLVTRQKIIQYYLNTYAVTD